MRIRPFAPALAGFAFAACIIASLTGCKSDPEPAAGSPTFRFSADFDTSRYGFILTASFETPTDHDDCRFFHIGKMSPAQRKFNRTVKVAGSGVVAEVPLKMANSGKCAWELASVSVDPDAGKCSGPHFVSFLPPERTERVRESHPDSIDFACRRIEGSECIDCKESDGVIRHDYALKTDGDRVHFTLKDE